ncbi:electron transport complex subunit RsxA [Providencia rettgeri]|uniref:electron transport complex subunit RsxA n=1 Tax=Providencia rettgeri TaxID=587 RepID=UPI001E651E42|nr:electron transport complex subunit RsxA [Providencia rettgeri]UEK61256.1 electron transport complex subunit RsxA [Providencia rettgeri]HEP0307956.1 electron transport complex subunit RsxA [Providencia rettgeri]
MSEYLLMFFGAVFVNNFVLSKFLGLCPFMGTSKKIDTAIGMGFATAFVITLVSAFAWLADYFILKPFNLEYLRILVYILISAVVVQFAEMAMRKSTPHLYRILGIFLPLITTNCAVLAVPLLALNHQFTFLQAAFFGFSASVGFTLVIILFAAMRERLANANVPTPFKGSAISLITAGLMSLAFMGFTGLVKS